MILEFSGSPKMEIGLKDSKGKSPIDLADSMGFVRLYDLLSRYGAYPTV
jgi:ankyrin repeat protein